MFRLIKQVLIALLSFSRSLKSKCVSLNNEPCMISPSLIDLNPIKLSYYRFIINLDKCNGSCNAVDDLSTKIYFSREAKDANVKVLGVITRISEFKALINLIPCDYKFR